MTTFDKARAATHRALGLVKRGTDTARTRMEEMRAQRERNTLLKKLGVAYYAEYTGSGAHAPVENALAALNDHVREHGEQPMSSSPLSLSPTGTEPAGEERRTMDRSESRQARDIMHLGAECIRADDTVANAAQKMRELDIGSMPICGEDDRLHGIITDRDIVVKCIAEGRDPMTVRVGDLAQETLRWADASSSIGDVLHEMEEHRIKRLPVIDNHRIVGMISEADLARNLDEHQLAKFVEKVYARP